MPRPDFRSENRNGMLRVAFTRHPRFVDQQFFVNGLKMVIADKIRTLVEILKSS